MQKEKQSRTRKTSLKTKTKEGQTETWDEGLYRSFTQHKKGLMVPSKEGVELGESFMFFLDLEYKIRIERETRANYYRLFLPLAISKSFSTVLIYCGLSNKKIIVCSLLLKWDSTTVQHQLDRRWSKKMAKKFDVKCCLPFLAAFQLKPNGDDNSLNPMNVYLSTRLPLLLLFFLSKLCCGIAASATASVKIINAKYFFIVENFHCFYGFCFVFISRRTKSGVKVSTRRLHLI